MMDIIDHGEWVIYTPEKSNLPATVMFCRRVADGKDWYEYLRTSFKPDTMKLTLKEYDGSLIVQAAHRDPSNLFPAGTRLIEIDAEGEPETFFQCRFDGNLTGLGLGSGTLLPRMTTPVTKLSFMLALHELGLLTDWETYVRAAQDVRLRLRLGAEQHMAANDPNLLRAARDLGWDEAALKNIFDLARKQQEPPWQT
jgi:hypothetical protein